MILFLATVMVQEAENFLSELFLMRNPLPSMFLSCVIFSHGVLEKKKKKKKKKKRENAKSHCQYPVPDLKVEREIELSG